MFKLLLGVFLGSGLGGCLRFLVSHYMTKAIGNGSAVAMFPWATFAVNIVGCFLIGLIYGLVANGSVNLSPEMKTFLTAGFCGGLTTFSTFSHENYLLFEGNHIGMLLIYAAVSLVTGFGAAWLGHAVAFKP